MSNMWTDSLLTGEGQIDLQHKTLFELIEQYFESCKTSTNNDEIFKVIDYLEDYVRIHFSYEELVQKKNHYPDYENHKKLHNSYKSMVKELKTKLKENGPTSIMIMRANTMIFQWLFNHIKKEDKKIGLYLETHTKSA